MYVQNTDMSAAGNPDEFLARAGMRLRAAIAEPVLDSRIVSWYAEAGILSTRGFLSEIRERLYERLLPRPHQPGELREAFEQVFASPRDAEWVRTAPREKWIELASAIAGEGAQGREVFDRLRRGMTGAAQVLALRIAASGTETELLHIDPDAERRESPFLALQHEVAMFLLAAEAAEGDSPIAIEPPKHARVLVAQCHEAVARLRTIGRRRGTSIRITYLLVRMDQQLARLDILLRALGSTGEDRRDACFELFESLADAGATRLSVAHVWEANTRILARRITESAGRTGEHYATSNRAEYFGMMRAAMGAGIFIAFMALFKVHVRTLHLPPLIDMILLCADYSLGFVVIHLFHLAVATKQPAMTAATIAATIEDTQAGRAPLDDLAVLIASVVRTQIVAILGNIAIAMPLAMLVAFLYAESSGTPMLDPAKSASMIAELDPIAGYALLHAAIAGVWLFFSGLVSGWYDNRCALLDIPERLRGSIWLRWLPAGARDRIAEYVDGNYGALWGNAVFGALLAATGFVGAITGLPIDIRHVAFASANLGYAAASASIPVAQFFQAFVFVLLVGAVNLAVSFALALRVAVRSRGLTLRRSREFARAMLALVRSRPRDFFLPPRG